MIRLWWAIRDWVDRWARWLAAGAIAAVLIISHAWTWSTSAELAGARVLRAWDKERLDAAGAQARDYLKAYKALDAAQVQYHREVQENAATARKQASAARSLTTGRECLSAELVRVLNAGAPDAELSADTGVAAAGSGAAAADSGHAASDADVNDWIEQVRAQYGVCRARIRAIGRFDQERSR